MSDNNGSSYETPASDEKPRNTACTSPFQELFKSEVVNQKSQKDPGQKEKGDKLMEDQTTLQDIDHKDIKVGLNYA